MRRTLFFLALTPVLTLASCGDSDPVTEGVGDIDRASLLAVKAEMRTLANSIQNFVAQEGRYPEDLEELAEKGPASPGALTDPWGRPYLYLNPGPDFELLSYGADGEEGGEGNYTDISSRDF